MFEDGLDLLSEAEATDLWLVLEDEPNQRMTFRMPAVLHATESTHDALIELYRHGDEATQRLIGERYLELYG